MHDDLEAALRLDVRVGVDGAIGLDGCRSRNEYSIAGKDGPAEADLVFVRRPGPDSSPFNHQGILPEAGSIV